MKMLADKKQTGFSLIEMMIAITLGLLLIAVVASVFMTSNKNYIQDENYSTMSENGRFALKRLAYELSMASYWGQMLNPGPSDITRDASVNSGHCGVTYDSSTPVIVYNNASPATVGATHTCLVQDRIYDVADTVANHEPDIIAIKRSGGINRAGALTSADVNTILLYTNANGKLGKLYQYNGSNDPAADQTAWRFHSKIYYICNKDENGNAIEPSALCVQTLNNSQELEQIRLVDGIEDLQVQFGIDSNEDGLPEKFVSNPTTAELVTAISARIRLLAVSLDPVPGYENKKKYNLGNGDYTIFDTSHYGRVYETTVMLRNTAYLAAID